MNRNIKLSRAFQLLGMFCGLFLITSVLVKGSSFNSENERLNSSYFKTNPEGARNTVFQEPSATLPHDFLSIFSAVEESEPTDESGDEEAAESNFPVHISYFNDNFLKSSFVSFNLSFQKRITIPFFLLHHSWKIPFN